MAIFESRANKYTHTQNHSVYGTILTKRAKDIILNERTIFLFQSLTCTTSQLVFLGTE